jgi:hypothetical protein
MSTPAPPLRKSLPPAPKIVSFNVPGTPPITPEETKELVMVSFPPVPRMPDILTPAQSEEFSKDFPN